MLQSNITARSGLIAQQQRLDIIANNMANINTNGYKAVRADFSDMLYQTMMRPLQPQDGLNLQKGHGTILGATVRNFNQGAGQMTQRLLDVMIVGDGFFAAQDLNGETLYTRDGSFALSQEEDGSYLVTGSGRYILDVNGNRINLGDTPESNLEIQSDGTIWAVTTTPATADSAPVTTRTLLGQLGLYRFQNTAGLEAVSTNMYQQTENSGEAQAVGMEGGVSVQQGMLEGSNVDLATEMTRMIRAQRAFSMASKALTTADEMDAKANQLRT